MSVSDLVDPLGAGPGLDDGEVARLRAVLGERFRIDEAMARRPLRTVYSAFDQEAKREVAIKVVAFDTAAHPEVAARLEQQLFGASELGYRGVMPPTHMAVLDGGLIYISHLAGSGSAAELLRPGGLLRVDEVQLVVSEVAAALARAHERGMVHGGLKPTNILFEADGHPRVSDFGIADTLVATGLLSGREAFRERMYAAPEQWRGARVDSSADQYSLGVLAYELLTGRGRYVECGTDGVATLEPISVLANVPLGPDVPLYINEALRTALNASPANRFATITEFAEAFAGGAAPRRRGLPTYAPDLRKRRRKRLAVPYGWLALAALVLLMLDPRTNAVLRYSWNAIWDAYHPPQVTVDVSDFLSPEPHARGPTGASTSTRSGFAGSWLARLKSVVLGRTSPPPAPAYISVSVDSGTSLVIIDGIPRGVTPIVVAVGAGHHLVSVRSTPGREPPLAGVNVAARDTVRLTFRR